VCTESITNRQVEMYVLPVRRPSVVHCKCFAAAYTIHLRLIDCIRVRLPYIIKHVEIRTTLFASVSDLGTITTSLRCTQEIMFCREVLWIWMMIHTSLSCSVQDCAQLTLQTRLCSTSNTDEVRRTGFLPCRPCCMELATG